MASFTDSLTDRLSRYHPKVIDLSLGRLERLLENLGHPERRLPPVIHVAGTNGKGSVVAMLRAMLAAAGNRVHTYTSPHLIRFHERITLAAPGNPEGRPIGDDTLRTVLDEAERANGDAPITFFEITTAAAFLAYARTPADALVLEVGLGGRLDATNVVERPAVCAITPVSRDHADYLGTDIADIAREKAGIIKSGVPCVIGKQDEQARVAILTTAEQVGAPLYVADQDFRAYEERGRMVYQDATSLIDLPLPRLIGRHQIDNAAIAIAAARLFSDQRLSPDALATGLEAADWPARLQRLDRHTVGIGASKLDAGSELWLDGGHNPDAGRALAQSMADLEDGQPRPLYLIVGMMGNKDIAGFLAPFATLARSVVAIPIPDQPNAATPEKVVESAESIGIAAAAAEDLDGALAKITAMHKHGGQADTQPRILICGSLYLAGSVLRRLEPA